MHKVSTCVSLLFVVQLVFAGYGDEEYGYPSWQERAAHTITNVVRTDPEHYVAKYGTDYDYDMTGILAGYVPKFPLYWVLGLNNASRVYSQFLSQDACLGHNFCNGTELGSYLSNNYYACAAHGYGENINVNHDEPRANINQWLCDGIPCAPNGAYAGHRDNILDKTSFGFKALGNGFASRSGAKYNSYWTQDYGLDLCPTITNKIASGSHIFQNAGKTKFIVTYYDSGNQAPQQASVIIAGNTYSLTLDLGTSSLGTYIFETTSASACRNYYFYFKDASGNEYYFPETGSLQTFKEGSCASAWVAGRTGGTATTGSGSTTSDTASSTSTTASAATTTGTTTSSSASASSTSTTAAAATTGGVVTTGSVITTGTVVTTTGGAPNLYFGTTICYLSLVIQGDFSTFDQTAFAQNFAATLGISASRVLIQAVSVGSFSNSVKIDFTLLELPGETASQTVMFSAFNLVMSHDPAFPNHGITVFTINGWFFTNTNGASIPATSTSTPAFSYDATKDQNKSSTKSSNTALIGGIVGGAVGLVAIVGAVVAIIVIRRRRASGPGSFY